MKALYFECRKSEDWESKADSDLDQFSWETSRIKAKEMVRWTKVLKDLISDSHILIPGVQLGNLLPTRTSHGKLTLILKGEGSCKAHVLVNLPDCPFLITETPLVLSHFLQFISWVTNP